ncbi:MAG: hypothetical protein R3C11_22890 [Planctomycetaceae bacterium]
MSNSRPRTGYTLIELIVSIGASSFLVMGLGSSLYLAGQAISPSQVLESTLDATEALHNFTDDVQNAIYLSEHTDKVIEFVVQDMDGDNSPDVVRYEWGGDPGDPLIKKFNFGTPVQVLDSVQNFELKYNSRSTIEYFPPSLVESEEQLIGGELIVISGTQRVLAIWSGSWPAFYFTPTLAPGAEGWNLSRVKVGLRQDDPSENGQFYFQMRPAANDHTPTSEVLDQILISESSLSSTMKVEEYDFSAVKGLLPTDRLAGVFEFVSGANAGQVKYHYKNGTANAHAMISYNQGSTWNYDTDNYEIVYHEVYGTYYTGSGNGMTVTRNYQTGLNATLQIGDTTASQVRTGIPLLNSPELLVRQWELDFDIDPLTTDTNYDNLNDWSLTSGADFDTNTLVSGIWDADNTVLRTSPDHDFTHPTTIVVRMRATTTGGDGAVYEHYADWDNSDAFALRLRVTRQADDTQWFIAESQTTPGVWSQVVKVENLPLDFIEARVVISPDDSNHAIFLQGNLLDNYAYHA